MKKITLATKLNITRTLQQPRQLQVNSATQKTHNRTTMIRSEIITTLAEKFPALKKDDAEACVTTILDAIADQVSKDGRVEIRGFGTFQLNIRLHRTARNPKTGDKVAVPAKPCPHFKAGKELRDRVDC